MLRAAPFTTPSLLTLTNETVRQKKGLRWQFLPTNIWPDGNCATILCVRVCVCVTSRPCETERLFVVCVLILSYQNLFQLRYECGDCTDGFSGNEPLCLTQKASTRSRSRRDSLRKHYVIKSSFLFFFFFTLFYVTRSFQWIGRNLSLMLTVCSASVIFNCSIYFLAHQ